jgi:WD40 repeat protein
MLSRCRFLLRSACLILFLVWPALGEAPEGGKDVHGDPLPEHVLARMGTVRFRHGDRTTSVAFAPDGKTVASAGDDGAVCLWNAATGQLLHKLEGHSHQVKAVAFAPNGKLLASGSWDETIRLWDAATGRLVRRIRAEGQPISCLAFTPDGETLASAGLDQRIRLWDTARGTERQRLSGHGKGEITSLAFAPDGKSLASGGQDCTVRLWDVESGREQHKWEAAEVKNGVPSPVAFAADGKWLAAAPGAAAVLVLDPATGKEVRRLTPNAGFVYALTFTPDSKMLASAGTFDATFGIPLAARIFAAAASRAKPSGPLLSLPTASSSPPRKE